MVEWLTVTGGGVAAWRVADCPTDNMHPAFVLLQACHSHVNHTFAHLDKDAPNPFAPGSVHVA